jgi:hypothetical protein
MTKLLSGARLRLRYTDRFVFDMRTVRHNAWKYYYLSTPVDEVNAANVPTPQDGNLRPLGPRLPLS